MDCKSTLRDVQIWMEMGYLQMSIFVPIVLLDGQSMRMAVQSCKNLYNGHQEQLSMGLWILYQHSLFQLWMVPLPSKTSGLAPMFTFSCSNTPIPVGTRIRVRGQQILGRLFEIYLTIRTCSMVRLIPRTTTMSSLEKAMLKHV